MSSKAAYDSLFNTLFIVISLTVAPFIAVQLQTQIAGYRWWAVLSFDLPIMCTIGIWGFAVFSDSAHWRVVGWSALVYQITRAPFVIAADVLGISNFVETPWGELFPPVSTVIEAALSLLFAYLILTRYYSVVNVRKRTTDYLILGSTIGALGVYTFLIAFILSA
jgi:hypothetical protein